MHRIGINYSDGTNLRGLRIGPIEFAVLRDPDGRLTWQILWPHMFRIRGRQEQW